MTRRPRADRRVLLPAVLLMLVMVAGCTRPSAGWSGFASTDPEGWNPLRSYELTPVPPDSAPRWTGLWDVVLCVRYLPSAPCDALTLTVTEENAAADTLASRDIRFTLFGADGRREGRGLYGVYEICDTLRTGFTPPEGYTVTWSVPPGAAAPHGITDVGVIISYPGGSRLPWVRMDF